MVWLWYVQLRIVKVFVPPNIYKKSDSPMMVDSKEIEIKIQIIN